MLDLGRVGYCLLGILLMTPIAAAQAPPQPASSAVVIPEPYIPPLRAAPSRLDDGLRNTPSIVVVRSEPLPQSPPEAPALLPDEEPPMPAEEVEGDDAITTCSEPCHTGYSLRGRYQEAVARTKACLQHSHWGYADRFCERPFGTCVCAHMRTQIANARAARMALYRYDFHDGALDAPFKLNHHGQLRLKEMGQAMQDLVHPIVVENTPEDPALAKARRDHVLSFLKQQNLPMPEELVVIGEAKVGGLSGEEALAAHETMISPYTTVSSGGSQQATEMGASYGTSQTSGGSEE